MRVKHLIKVTIALTHDETNALARLLTRMCNESYSDELTTSEKKIAHDLRAALYDNVPHIN